VPTQVRAYAASANPTEKALVSTELTNFVHKGLTGEINIETFNLHVKQYYIIVRRKPSANRPTDEDTLEMLRNIMNKNANCPSSTSSCTRATSSARS
jgi:hypothetical protein